MPKFSIIIPCFNASKTIESTLTSLRVQSVDEWEVICLDDGSTDDTCDRIQSIAACDGRISLHRNPRKGPSAARNHGVNVLARSDIIAFCDADDMWTATKLSELIEAFSDASVDGVFAEIGFFSEVIGDTSVRSTAPRGSLTVQTLLGENPVCTMSNLAIRRDAFLRTGGFDENMVHNEDLDWLIRIVGRGARVVGLPILQTFYRRSSGGLSTDLSAMERGRERALASAAQLGILPSGAAHATYSRYLARRALRLGLGRTTAIKHTLKGLLQSPLGFLLPLNRGLPTLVASAIAAAMPASVTRRLFA